MVTDLSMEVVLIQKIDIYNTKQREVFENEVSIVHMKIKHIS